MKVIYDRTVVFEIGSLKTQIYKQFGLHCSIAFSLVKVISSQVQSLALQKYSWMFVWPFQLKLKSSAFYHFKIISSFCLELTCDKLVSNFHRLSILYSAFLALLFIINNYFNNDYFYNNLYSYLIFVVFKALFLYRNWIKKMRMHLKCLCQKSHQRGEL